MDAVHVRVRERDVIEKGLPRHSVVGLGLVRWDAPLVAPEHVHAMRDRVARLGHHSLGFDARHLAAVGEAFHLASRFVRHES
jgi:hypothetical protein